MHLHEENPERIDECIKLYTEDAIWETPARNVSYRGRETIKNMYLRVIPSAEFILRPHAGQTSGSAFGVTADGRVTVTPRFKFCATAVGSTLVLRGHPLVIDTHLADSDLVSLDFFNLIPQTQRELTAVLLPISSREYP